MRLIILGKARHDPYFSDLITTAYHQVINGTEPHLTSSDGDCLCFLQHEANDDCGVDVRVNSEIIELVISQAQPPTLDTLSKIMRQAILQFTTK